MQARIQGEGFSDMLRTEEKFCMSLFDEAMHKDHLFWKEKPKVNWHLEGDRNTKYFHIISTIKTQLRVYMILTLMES